MAATRARLRLFISHPSYTVDRYGRRWETRRSSFLDPVVEGYSDTPVLALERGLGAPQPLPAEEEEVVVEDEGGDLAEELGGVAAGEAGAAAAGEEEEEEEAAAEEEGG